MPKQMRTTTGVLSSDILEEQFGPTKVEVLYQDAVTRIICTRALASGQVLELSYVAFVKSGAEKFPGAHRSVIAGESMGKAFRTAGIKFTRQQQTACRYNLPENFERWFERPGAATVVAVSILVGPGKTAYAEILETYSPEVQWAPQAGKPNMKQLAALTLLDEFLASQAAA